MIKNIVFDIGNVLIRWSPTHIVEQVFPGHHDHQQLAHEIFRSPIWFDLNLGKITELEAVKAYQHKLGLQHEKSASLMTEVKKSLTPVEGSFELLNELHAQYPIYALTDNVHEIVDYLKRKYDFWNKFHGAVVSAEVGYLKPSPEIYQHLLERYQLEPSHTVFLDDVLHNVEGARAAGMHAIQFKTAQQCREELRSLGVMR